jgi:hypothetical protein
MNCVSVKNKQSKERCTAKALVGMQFCGRHCRAKVKQLWQPVDKNAMAKKIQAAWRGYAIFKIITLAGPNALNRLKSNDYEEITTFVSKDKQNPLEYFEFEENGVNFWFDIKSLYQWSCNEETPRNPYTKAELTLDTRRRMRELITIRKCHKQHIMVTILFRDQTVESRANQLCQILEENLSGTDYWYGRISPNEFLQMNIIHLEVFLSVIMSDLITWCNLRRSSSLRVRICWMINDLMHDIITKDDPVLTTIRCLIFMLGRIKNAKPLCFIIWSALHRM